MGVRPGGSSCWTETGRTRSRSVAELQFCSTIYYSSLLNINCVVLACHLCRTRYNTAEPPKHHGYTDALFLCWFSCLQHMMRQIAASVQQIERLFLRQDELSCKTLFSENTATLRRSRGSIIHGVTAPPSEFCQ